MVDEKIVLKKVIEEISNKENVLDDLNKYYNERLTDINFKKLFLELVYSCDAISAEDKNSFFRDVFYSNIDIKLVIKYTANLSIEESVDVLLYNTFNPKMEDVLSFAREHNASNEILKKIYFKYAKIVADSGFEEITKNLIKLNPSNEELISFIKNVITPDNKMKLFRVFGYLFIKRGLSFELSKFFFEPDFKLRKSTNKNLLIDVYEACYYTGIFNSCILSHLKEFDYNMMEEFIDYLLDRKYYYFIDNYNVCSYLDEKQVHKIINALISNLGNREDYNTYLIRATRYASDEDYKKVCSLFTNSSDIEFILSLHGRFNEELLDNYLSITPAESVMYFYKSIDASERIINYTLDYYLKTNNISGLVQLASRYNVDLQVINSLILQSSTEDMYAYAMNVENVSLDVICKEVVKRGVFDDIIAFLNVPSANIKLLFDGALNLVSNGEDILKLVDALPKNDDNISLESCMEKLTQFGDINSIIAFAKSEEDIDKTILEDYILSLNDYQTIIRYVSDVTNYNRDKFMDKVIEICEMDDIIDYCINYKLNSFDKLVMLLINKGSGENICFVLKYFLKKGYFKDASLFFNELINRESAYVNEVVNFILQDTIYSQIITSLDIEKLKAVLRMSSVNNRVIILREVSIAYKNEPDKLSQIADYLERLDNSKESLEDIIDQALLLGFAEIVSKKELDKKELFNAMIENFSKYVIALRVYLEYLTEDKEFDIKGLDDEYLSYKYVKDNEKTMISDKHI